MRIISITNQKGGCGKTTTAVNLAATLAVNNRRVLLIDLDPQSHATLGLNISANHSIYNVLSKLADKRVPLAEIIEKVTDNFDIAPSSIVLSTLEQELAGEIGRESRLLDALNNFKGNYDYILIDCPPNLGILTINAIRAAREIIVPVEASRFAFEGLGQLIEIIKLVQERLKHNVEFRVLVTNFDSRLQHSFKMLDKIKATFQKSLFATIIHVNVKLKEAQSSGMHILSHDKYCRGAKDYFSLAREIITLEEAGSVSPRLEEVKPREQLKERMKDRMQEIIREKVPQLVQEVEFSLLAPGANDVFVAGDFNKWQIDENSRMEKYDGLWRRKIKLRSGTYHYRFVIDGSWTDDPSNPVRQTNPYGEMDSLIEVHSK